jgi:hypothetical protein
MYLNDNKALDSHIKNSTFTNQDGKILTELSEQQYNMWYEGAKRDIEQTTELINNQFIVFLSTVIETIVEDFFTVIFVNQPNRMLSIKAKESIGISLKDFLKTDSKEDYIAKLATRAADHCNSGTVTNRVNKIKEISGLNLSKKEIDTWKEIYKIRNEIVHEAKKYKDIFDRLIVFSDFVEEFLLTLAIKLKNMGVHVVDKGGFLEPFEISEINNDSEELK